MRIEEVFFGFGDNADRLAKYQILLGVLLVLSGIAIVLFPAILVALVASAIVLAGVGLIASGWRLRRLGYWAPAFSGVGVFEW